jgi:hypothetical protein
MRLLDGARRRPIRDVGAREGEGPVDVISAAGVKLGAVVGERE